MIAPNLTGSNRQAVGLLLSHRLLAMSRRHSQSIRPVVTALRLQTLDYGAQRPHEDPRKVDLLSPAIDVAHFLLGDVYR